MSRFAQRLGLGCLQDLAPLLIGRNPREAREVGKKPALPLPAEGLARRVAPAADRVIGPHPLLHQVVVPEAPRPLFSGDVHNGPDARIWAI